MLTLIRRYSHVNWAIADQAVVSGANFLTGILVARFIGIEEFGQFALAWVLLEITLSVQNSLIIMPMMSIGPKHAESEMPAFFGAVIAQQAAFIVLSIIVSLFGVWVAARFYPEWVDIAAALACLLAMSQFQNFMRRYLFTRSLPLTAFVSDALRYLGQIAVLIVLLQFIAMDAADALWIHSGTAFAGAVFGACFINQIAWERQVLLGTLRRHWDFAKWLLCSEIMRAATGNLFILVAGAMLGATAVGGIRAAQQMVGICHIVQLGLENIVPVRAARHFRDGQFRALLVYIKRFALLGGLAIGAIVATAAAAPEFWLGIAYGAEYQAQGYLVQWWAVVYFLGFLSRPPAIGLRTIERTDVIFTVQLVSAIFAAITVYPIIHYFGVVGVMTGIVGIVVIRLVMMSRYFLKLVPE